MAKEKALSQQEIDALLNQSQGDTVKPAPSPPPSPPSPSAPSEPPPTESRPGVYSVSTTPLPDPPPTAPGQAAGPTSSSDVIGQTIRTFRADLDNLVRRMDVIEALVGEIKGVQGQSMQLPPELHAAPSQIQGLEGKLGQIEQKLRASLGVGVRDTFKCTHCGTDGLVAIHLKCTGCSHETWWGWWAPRQGK